ncbi:LOW QUALITY PROTEIN: heme-binding protein soul3 [Triplophysa rosa]|uniref:LOW QUALITY PROTEIN: heme-binding protein soul3 n=1 Tax=Triplophysa rosa TaxID=992332 RepID=UPI002546019D|nr:LOW QUALITY PROTEIN: heme-binding protein soul3 [Triplophysa rosa]
MDRGECRMSGGGGGGGLISLDDLESVSEEQLSDSTEVEHEETTEEQDRLLNYWTDVARGHQVDVPTDMAEPIQQITSNNDGRHTRERVPYTLITRKEKCGEVLWEKRQYEKANWACITVYEDTYEQSICYGFMKIMKYICQQNSAGSYLGMTIPIVTVVRTDDAHTTLSRAVTVAYYLPPSHQNDPPRPYDPEILIEHWPGTIIYSRPFAGATNELSIIGEISGLAEVLDSSAVCVNDSFIVAGYTNPAAVNRQNEIWFHERL